MASFDFMIRKISNGSERVKTNTDWCLWARFKLGSTDSLPTRVRPAPTNGLIKTFPFARGLSLKVTGDEIEGMASELNDRLEDVSSRGQRSAADSEIERQLSASRAVIQSRITIKAISNGESCLRGGGGLQGLAMIVAYSRFVVPSANSDFTSRSSDTVGSPASILAMRD